MTGPGPADDPPTEALPVRASAGDDAAGPAGADAESATARRTRLVVIASTTVIGIAGLLLAFFLGTRLAPPAPPPASGTSPSATAAPTATPSPTPTATPQALPQGAASPGVHEWNELGGGECLEPYTSPWEREFTVVDCAAPHSGQLLARGGFDGDAAAPYPGDQALTAELNLRCTAPEVLDLDAAAAYADVQVQAAYPPGEEQWKAGDRAYFCFVSRTSGQPLTGSIAAGR